MYVPPSFHLDDDAAWQVVERRGFGTLVINAPDGLQATPLPFVVDRSAETPRLLAHLAKVNPSLAAIGDGADALVLVDLLDAYVSPNWYPSKVEHGRVVPTWNYVTVHLHGTVECRPEAAWLHDQVSRLTAIHERAMPQPWSVDDAPPEYIEGALRGIVGLEIAVHRVEGKAKLSQNRPAADAASVERAYRVRGQTEIADAMSTVNRREPG